MKRTNCTVHGRIVITTPEGGKCEIEWLRSKNIDMTAALCFFAQIAGGALDLPRGVLARAIRAEIRRHRKTDGIPDFLRRAVPSRSRERKLKLVNKTEVRDG